MKPIELNISTHWATDLNQNRLGDVGDELQIAINARNYSGRALGSDATLRGPRSQVLDDSGSGLITLPGIDFATRRSDALPDLTLSVAPTQTSNARAGELITLSVRPQNLVPATIAHRVAITHVVPANAIVPPNPATGDWEPWYCLGAGAPGTICVIDIGDVPYSAAPLPAIDLPLQILPQALPGPITGSAMIASLIEAESDLGNNTVSVPIQVLSSGPTPTPQPTPLPTPTPTPGQSSVTINLDAEPNSKQNFRITGPTGAFRLDDAVPDDGDSVSSAQAFALPTGTHPFTVEVPYSWNLADIQCNAGDVFTANLSTGRFDVQVRTNRPVSCTVSMARTVHILARVWDDQDGNGAIRSGEPYLSGWRVSLVAQATPFPPTRVIQTGNNGQANFTNQPATRYKMCEQLQAGWRNTRPTALDSAGAPCYWLSMAPGKVATIWYGNQLRSIAANAFSPFADEPVWVDRPDVPFDDAGYDGNVYDDTGNATTWEVYLPILLQ